MARSYYVVLGIPPDATAEDVRTAYRRLALKLHPDQSGLGSGPFLEIHEAYATLSDPARRQRYDLHQTPPLARMRPWGPAPEPIRPAPSIPDLRLDEFETFHPSFDELFDRLSRNYGLSERPKGERLESLGLEVLLDREEARHGGHVRIEIPARATCPLCAGRGAVSGQSCWRCFGRGAVDAQYPVDVTFPPGIPSGHVARLPLSAYGIDNFYLTVTFRVSDRLSTAFGRS
jgi:molecular chaperone DnaJ